MDERSARYFGREKCIPLFKTPGMETFGRACLLLDDDRYTSFSKEVEKCMSTVQNTSNTFPYNSEGICTSRNIDTIVTDAKLLSDTPTFQKAKELLVKRITSQPSKDELCKRGLEKWGMESAEFCNKYIPTFYPRIIYTDVEKCNRRCGLNRECVVDCTLEQMRLNRVFDGIELIDNTPYARQIEKYTEGVGSIHNKNGGEMKSIVMILLAFLLLGVVVYALYASKK